MVQKESSSTGTGKTFGLNKFSYPNNWIGNPELGSPKNPGSMKWPFGINK